MEQASGRSPRQPPKSASQADKVMLLCKRLSPQGVYTLDQVVGQIIRVDVFAVCIDPIIFVT